MMRCEQRTLDDIRALGGHEPQDERMFAAAAEVSAANLALYRTFLQPFVKAWMTPALADWMRQLHPLRLQYELVSDANPFAAMLARIASRSGKIKSRRRLETRWLSHRKQLPSRSSALSKAGVSGETAWRSRHFFPCTGRPLSRQRLESTPPLKARCGRRPNPPCINN